MCAPCEQPEPKARGRQQRRRIWEIRPSCSCLICGTCLSIPELRKIAAKARLRISADAADYAIHGHFVECTTEPGPISKLVQKALDRKYRSTIDRCSRLTSDPELRDFWTAALAKGDIPGPFWAVMTHPLTSEELALHIFGEVHMLSHLEGHSHRSDRRRVSALEQENARLTKVLSAQAASAQRKLEKRDIELKALKSLQETFRAASARLRQAEERLECFERGAETQALRARVAELEGALSLRERGLEEAEAALAQQQGTLTTCRVEIDGLKSKLRSVEAESAALAAMLRSTDGADFETENEARDKERCPFDLTGRSVLYVGGRSGLIAQYRSLVERANGRFYHHDGGIEENGRRLNSLLARGDVVLCPVDCVSHQACLKAKRFCKRTARTFVPLRSSGLSSFVNGLQQAAEAVASPGSSVETISLGQDESLSSNHETAHQQNGGT